MSPSRLHEFVLISLVFNTFLVGFHLCLYIAIDHLITLISSPYSINISLLKFSHGDPWRLILHVFCSYVFILSSFSAGNNIKSVWKMCLSKEA